MLLVSGWKALRWACLRANHRHRRNKPGDLSSVKEWEKRYLFGLCSPSVAAAVVTAITVPEYANLARKGSAINEQVNELVKAAGKDAKTEALKEQVWDFMALR